LNRVNPIQGYIMTGKNPLGNGKEPQSYEGLNVIVPVGGWRLVVSTRAPTTNDKKYPLGAIWINKTTSTSYQLCTNPGIWTVLGAAAGGDIQTLTGDSGGALLPTTGNMNLLGTANQVAVTGAGSTLTFSLVGPYTPATYTTNGVLIGKAASSIVATVAGTNGQLLIGSTGAAPAFGTVTTSTGLTITGGAASLALDIKTGGFAVVDQTSSSAAVAVQTMYVVDNGATLVTLTLPATAVQGSIFKVVGSSLGGWKIAQNASQQILGVGLSTTAGTSGSLSSSSKNDCVELIASVGGASTIWTVANFNGALTFV
jgi:hypothetical protein